MSMSEALLSLCQNRVPFCITSQGCPKVVDSNLTHWESLYARTTHRIHPPAFSLANVLFYTSSKPYTIKHYDESCPCRPTVKNFAFSPGKPIPPPIPPHSAMMSNKSCARKPP